MKDKPSLHTSKNSYANQAGGEPQDPDDIQLQDFSEAPDYDRPAGLSDEQVSNIAIDLLGTMESSHNENGGFGRMHRAS